MSSHNTQLLVHESLAPAVPIGPLPDAWRRVIVPGVDRPVVAGPGGLVVVHLRRGSTHAVGMPVVDDDRRPWSHDHRHQISSPEFTARLASQLVSWACGIDVRCTPVIVSVGGPSAPNARVDGVEVIDASELIAWLEHRPQRLGPDEIGLVLEHLDRDDRPLDAA